MGGDDLPRRIFRGLGAGQGSANGGCGLISSDQLQLAPSSHPSGASIGKVAALCVRARSLYKMLPGVECYDALRDARSYAGPWAVVAHPPCAQWGRLKGLARKDEALKALGPWCASQVRRWGGVLEHPAASSLWAAADLPLPGDRDRWGFTLSLPQSWFGHRADKATWFYVAGLEPADLEPLPVPIFAGAKSIEAMGIAEREATPPALARWLVAVARRCGGADLEAVELAPLGNLELWK